MSFSGILSNSSGINRLSLARLALFAAAILGLTLAAVTALIPVGFRLNASPAVTMLSGLVLFGAVFALNSSVHSCLVLAYSEADRVSLSVGFYYMANACGRP